MDPSDHTVVSSRSPLLSEAEARACVERIRGHFEGARRELLRLYDGQGWRALGYPSWRVHRVARPRRLA